MIGSGTLTAYVGSFPLDGEAYGSMVGSLQLMILATLSFPFHTTPLWPYEGYSRLLKRYVDYKLL